MVDAVLGLSNKSGLTDEIEIEGVIGKSLVRVDNTAKYSAPRELFRDRFCRKRTVRFPACNGV
ncbi:MAG: hypothetical protein IPP88_10580 [Betaproteobacteria bacterium]|nr:hypothetical protein [Betaproteobacteria bacterium]